MKRPFFGGIHPRYNKEISKGTAEPAVIVPKQVIIPMRQHIGVPCTPLVKVGERVLRGQMIGDGEGMCVPVHASVSGTVSAIKEMPHPSGSAVLSVVIDNDFKDTDFTPDAPVDLSAEFDTDRVLHIIRDAGIVGMGGAAFPGSVKALSAMGNIDTLIANACECEPYITSDDTLLRTSPRHVLEGMMILCRILSPARAVIAIEDNKPEAISQLRLMAAEYPSIEVQVLPTRYPQGAEKQLILAVTGREVPPGGLPVSVGCVVFNVSTFAAIYNAIRHSTPLIQRIVTVSGEAVAHPQNFRVPLGTPFADLIEAAGGLSDDAERVISGGPMMGTAQSDLSVPVVKATNAVLCMTKDKNSMSCAPVCIRCGKCVSVCPMHLQPLYMYRYTLAGQANELRRLNLSDCMECGCCAFTCPGKLPLVESFRAGKKLIKEEA